MKRISIQIPLISECSVMDCGYNRNASCYARAITIGDGENPNCDTYFNTSDLSQHAKSRSNPAGVGACKVSACRFNHDYECMTDEIMVGSGHCLTFMRR